MKIRSFIAIAALVVSGFTSNFAVADAAIIVNPSASFSNTVEGDFTDTWAFQFLQPSKVAASITNVEVTFGSFSFGGITNFQATFNGFPLLYQFSTQNIPPFTTKVQVLAGGGSFAAGTYNLVVKGITGSGGASYGGNIVAAPIPEPESYAMLLVGLGLMGALVRRPIKSKSV